MLPSEDRNQVSNSKHIKRPMNCFMVWSKEKRCQILKHNPGINNAEVSKALGVAWRRLSIQEKKPYVEKAKKLSEEHMLENPNYKYKPKRRKETPFVEKAKKIKTDSFENDRELNNEEINAATFGHPLSFPVALNYPQRFHHRYNLSAIHEIPVEMNHFKSFKPSPQYSSLSEGSSSNVPYNFDPEVLGRRRYEMTRKKESEPVNSHLTSSHIPGSPFTFMASGALQPSFPCACHLVCPVRHPLPTFPVPWHRFPMSYSHTDSNADRQLQISGSAHPFDMIERVGITRTCHTEPINRLDAEYFYRNGWENCRK